MVGFSSVTQLIFGDNLKSDNVEHFYLYVTVYRCQNWNHKAQTAYIRIWKQIPHLETEIDDPDIRARQAKPKWIPQELIAYKELTDKNSGVTPRLLGWSREQQDGSGLVPGGFLVSLAWEEVPGTQLGDQLGSEAFWKLGQDERKRVRGP
ncbi:hypothetical protein PENFLA_c093G07795 [Penicillium flavigenum]|uniref:Uncharacterized protein n=1 Tax=Penicillium flavigenum TaxID=254877 RepID=A0A1V6S8P9_9EURO|nr:hypothetical protein PENFLA_c093G07795 [Penicillium flavigenum]